MMSKEKYFFNWPQGLSHICRTFQENPSGSSRIWQAHRNWPGNASMFEMIWVLISCAAGNFARGCIRREILEYFDRLIRQFRRCKYPIAHRLATLHSAAVSSKKSAELISTSKSKLYTNLLILFKLTLLITLPVHAIILLFLVNWQILSCN
jgi:hypothetical protein